MSEQQDLSFFTRVVHAGTDDGEHHGALSVPIYHASTFELPDADEGAAIHNEEKPGYYYGRLGNPTQSALEAAMSDLEGAEASIALASGMAAVSGVILSLLKTGDHIVAPISGYSTTANFLNYIAENFGISSTFVDARETADYADALQDNTKLLWVETPSNPLLNITDISAVSRLARERGLYCIVDNTFATPFNQLPLSLGAHAVIHSATKYLGGHSDVTGGIAAGNADVIERVRKGANKYFGGNISPNAAWLVLRGIKTLALRMERHNSNAFAIAHMLSGHPAVSAVYYAGLPTHEGHEIAKRQMSKGFGGMVSFDVGSFEAGKAFVNNVRLCKLATSLGGVETIVQHSASMTHATLTPEEKTKAGISDGLIRLSVGIEYAEDLIADIQQALEHIR
ncbi:MAG: PLP-dependent transferase [Acidobacteriota bacterium]|nr:MAG: PLP-dependent transferase [Acidobacteriota bacterium]